MKRIGLPDSEYVAGTAASGHVHVFSGGQSATAYPGQPTAGEAEVNLMPGAPQSSAALWSSADQLMPFDITMLSCEGRETYNANPQALEAYLNAGGRAFASHYHYAWFSGPDRRPGASTYTAPADWGRSLAAWTTDPMTAGTVGPIGGHHRSRRSTARTHAVHQGNGALRSGW